MCVRHLVNPRDNLAKLYQSSIYRLFKSKLHACKLNACLEFYQGSTPAARAAWLLRVEGMIPVPLDGEEATGQIADFLAVPAPTKTSAPPPTVDKRARLKTLLLEAGAAARARQRKQDARLRQRANRIT